MSFTGLPALWSSADFIGSFSDDFLEVRTDILLNDMIPSRQRATLMSVNSFVFFYDYDRPFHRIWMDHVIVKNLPIEKNAHQFLLMSVFFKMIKHRRSCQSAVRGLRGCASPPHSPPLSLSSTTSRHRHTRGTSLSSFSISCRIPGYSFSSDIAVPDQPHMVNGFFKAPPFT